MKRLIITVCVILIAAAGMAGAGCSGGTGAIEFGDVDTAADAGDVSDVADTSGGTSSAATEGQCDPVIITNTVIQVVGGDEDLEGEPEGQTCLMSRVPDDASFVISVLKGAQDVVVAMKDVIPDSEVDAHEMLGDIMTPFDDLGLEEVVGFAKFKYVYDLMDKPDDKCRECVNLACPSCLGEAEVLCNSFSPPPDDIERCAWEQASPENPIVDCANNCVAGCAEKCTEEKPEPESFGILVRWLPSDDDADGTQKFTELDAFRIDINKDNLERAVDKWHDRCDPDLQTCISNNDLKPTELEPEKMMEIKQLDPNTALVYSQAVEPTLIEPVRICKFIRFDGIPTRPPVYAELYDLKLFMKVKPGEAFTEATRDSRKLVAGIDLKDSHYRVYAGMVKIGSLETGAYLSAVINLGDDFGMELWKQMMLGLVKD